MEQAVRVRVSHRVRQQVVGMNEILLECLLSSYAGWHPTSLPERRPLTVRYVRTREQGER